MKKIFFILCIGLTLTLNFCACSKKIDFTDYISDERYNIFLYSNDGTEIKINCNIRETPFCTDGIVGERENTLEVFVTLPKTYGKVEFSSEFLEGEMNYNAGDRNYTLSGSGSLSGETVDVSLNTDGKSETFTLQSVLYEGVIDTATALDCVLERDGELFTSMTENNIFCGEIFVRLLYDEGCYYYVGVCNRSKKITAFLVDGERGKIIATREISG
jgi:hypothetical protein